jgi:hypothetical protein
MAEKWLILARTASNYLSKLFDKTTPIPNRI